MIHSLGSFSLRATRAPIAEFNSHSTQTKDNILSAPRGSPIGSEDPGSVNGSCSSDMAFYFLSAFAGEFTLPTTLRLYSPSAVAERPQSGFPRMRGVGNSVNEGCSRIRPRCLLTSYSSSSPRHSRHTTSRSYPSFSLAPQNQQTPITSSADSANRVSSRFASSSSTP